MKPLKRFIADGFSSFYHTRGATPSSFAPGYLYFAHTGLSPNLNGKEFQAKALIIILQITTQYIDRSGVWGVKTSGRGFVLTRFLLPFHRLEKEEPVRLEDKNRSILIALFLLPHKNSN
ncbi:MAG: hypothetical protein WC384_01280 [Prolixibacteraceae bacterium]|jgi:hypothetical protein